MRIAMVSEHASPLAALGGHDAGGQNVHVAALARALAGFGHSVRVYTRRDDPHTPERVTLAPSVEVVHVPAGPARAVPKDDLLPWMPAMAERLRSEWADARTRPDVVHAHFWMSGWASRRALAALPGPPPAAITFHALGVVKRRNQGSADTSPPQRCGIEQELASQAAGIVATCQDEVRELLALGAPPHRLHVVPCGVDVEQFAPWGPRSVPWRPGSLRLLCMGRLVPRKGVDTAIEALEHLPEAELVVAGGPEPSGLATDEDVTRLRRLAVARGVGDRVYLLGRVDRDLAARLHRSADLTLCLPWYEPFGIVPLEAMASGTPVIASAVGGMLDSVEPGVTGLLVPPRDPGAVVRAVRELGSPLTRLGFGRAGVQRVRAGYNWALVAARTERIYQQLLTTPVLRPVDLTTRRHRARSLHAIPEEIR